MMQHGKPAAPIRCSSIARELEREFPEMDPDSIFARTGERLRDMTLKRKQLEENGSTTEVSNADE